MASHGIKSSGISRKKRDNKTLSNKEINQYADDLVRYVYESVVDEPFDVDEDELYEIVREEMTVDKPLSERDISLIVKKAMKDLEEE